MNGKLSIWIGRCLLTVSALLGSACGGDDSPQVGSQTNWLRACALDAECGSGMTCQCGACTRACDTAAVCSGLVGASCVAAMDPAAIGYCGGQLPATAGLCLPLCAAGTCPEGQICSAGVCSTPPALTAHVVVDQTQRRQSLTGLGATLAYAEATLLMHPRKAELFEAMFSNLGLDVMRLQNRYGRSADENLATATQIVTRATESLGRKPTTILTSWSPPAALKANGALVCQGNADTCTLAQSVAGGFDYAGYAAYWRASLDAYATVGLLPDYIGLQNNADYVPTAADPGEGCKFSGVETTQSVMVDGQLVATSYPGLARATTAVVAAMAGMSNAPKLIAPEASNYNALGEYTAALDPTQYDAVAHHQYGPNPTPNDVAALSRIATMGRNLGKPIFQTEGKSDGFGTSLWLHYSLVYEGVTAYLQNVLLRPTNLATTDPGALIGLTADDFILNDTYHALRHFALATDPGWIRVDAAADQTDLLVSAWQSPNQDALTLILVNSGINPHVAALDLGGFSATTSRVLRTVFDGVERSAELGSLPGEGGVRIPPRSIVTVALR